MKKYLCLIGVLGVLLCNTANSYAQKVAVKTNLLYDATTTMNLGLEIGLGKKWSLDLSGNYNPWKFDYTATIIYHSVNSCHSCRRGKQVQFFQHTFYSLLING